MTISVRIKHAFPGFALDVEFTAPAGVTALFGPSGAGKTTIINAVSGLFRPREGRIAIDDAVLYDGAARVFLPTRARRLGYVFQDGRLFPHLTVEANLMYGRRRARERMSDDEAARLIGTLGIGHLLKRRPATLSGGEKQRVALGRALLSSPRLLLLDEPLAALDSRTKDEILPYLERLRETRVPMLYVSHQESEIARLADHIVMLEAGRVRARGSVFDLFSRLSPETAALHDGAVVEGRLARHIDEQLSELAFDGGSLIVPRMAANPGQRVRVRIHARDITVALDAPGRISANNVLSVTVGEIEAAPTGRALVQLACGNTRLIAEITEHSLKRLALEPGMPAYAIIKSVTVDRRREPRHGSTGSP